MSKKFYAPFGCLDVEVQNLYQPNLENSQSTIFQLYVVDMDQNVRKFLGKQDRPIFEYIDPRSNYRYVEDEQLTKELFHIPPPLPDTTIPSSQRQDYYVPNLNQNKQILLSTMMRKHIANHQTTDDYKKMVPVPVKYQKASNRSALEAIYVFANSPEFLEKSVDSEKGDKNKIHEIFEPFALKREKRNNAEPKNTNINLPDTLSILVVRKKDYDSYLGNIKFMLTMDLYQSIVFHEHITAQERLSRKTKSPSMR
jgi:hypothetical protein